MTLRKMTLSMMTLNITSFRTLGRKMFKIMTLSIAPFCIIALSITIKM